MHEPMHSLSNLLLLQDISIDITEREPSDNPRGIPYKLLAEACIPGINLSDIGSIFEEHRICRSLSLWQQTTAVSSIVDTHHLVYALVTSNCAIIVSVYQQCNPYQGLWAVFVFLMRVFNV